VRSIRFREDGIGQTDHSSVDIIIVNTGESAAEIMAIGSAIGTREPRGRPPPRIDAAPDIVPSGIMVLKTGERRRINITRTPPPDPLEFIDIANRNIELAVAGEIRYRAISGGIERLTGFYRIYDPPSERFVASKNAEDEYQD
jgi:hypothetical protein